MEALGLAVKCYATLEGSGGMVRVEYSSTSSWNIGLNAP